MSKMNSATGSVTAKGPRKAFNKRRDIRTPRRYSSELVYLGRPNPESMRFTRIQFLQCLTATMVALLMAWLSRFSLHQQGPDFEAAPAMESKASAPDEDGFVWKTEQFADLKLIRYQIPGWEKLSAQAASVGVLPEHGGPQRSRHHVRPKQPLQPSHPSPARGHLRQLRGRPWHGGVAGV